ncbi:MAG: PilZ domain-containing protein [Candidatus Omnitrophica bacterium]|nr:PilZ domain-containing protein [Candidatus Omnitrophota bacterium]
MEQAVESRQYARFDCRVPVLCKRGTLLENSLTRDISKGGIGLLVQKFVPKDTNLIMELSLAPKTEPVLAVGKVRWVRKVGYGDRYRLGMQFTDISQSSKNRLAEYLAAER